MSPMYSIMFDYNFFMFIEMCPPLLSDSLDIKCSYNGNYTDCSNLSIPNTIAIPSCKPTHYFSSNGHEEVAKELHCQSNGMWDKELYRCNIMCNLIFLAYTLKALIHITFIVPKCFYSFYNIVKIKEDQIIRLSIIYRLI